MDIKEAIEIMEKHMEVILEYPDPYHDPDTDALETLIEFAKSKL